MTFQRSLVVLLAAMLALAGFPASAQEAAPTVIASGLNNPRALYYTPEGVLYIGEAGSGGDTVIPGPFGPIKVGASARILAIGADGGDPSPVVVNLPSSENFGDMVGVTGVYAANNALWLTIGIGPDSQPFNRALVALDLKTLRLSQFIDMYGVEARTNPDEDSSSIASNPSGFAVNEDDGTIYIADASANAVYTWTINEGLKLFHAWTDLPVPTAIAVGPDGDVYVGFLSAFPYISGSASVERWSADGTLKETYGSLSFVTGLTVGQDGAVYAVQMATDADDTGFIADSGSVVRLSADGATPVADGLNYPFAITQAPDGSFAVTVDSAFVGLGNGKVVKINP